VFGLFLIHLATNSWMLGGSASPMMAFLLLSSLLGFIGFIRKFSLMLLPDFD
jgi:hypothetical protein